MDDDLQMYQVDTGYYCAGFVINTRNGLCVEAAPILRWAEGKDISYLVNYFERKRFKVQKIG